MSHCSLNDRNSNLRPVPDRLAPLIRIIFRHAGLDPASIHPLRSGPGLARDEAIGNQSLHGAQPRNGCRIKSGMTSELLTVVRFRSCAGIRAGSQSHHRRPRIGNISLSQLFCSVLSFDNTGISNSANTNRSLWLAFQSARRHRRRREPGGRLRSPTWSGPEGSSHNGLRRVARLLFNTSYYFERTGRFYRRACCRAFDFRGQSHYPAK